MRIRRCEETDIVFTLYNDIYIINGKDTLEYIFKRKLSDQEVSAYTEEIELMCRNECLKHEMKLAPGATGLLEYLNEQKIPIARWEM